MWPNSLNVVSDGKSLDPNVFKAKINPKSPRDPEPQALAASPPRPVGLLLEGLLVIIEGLGFRIFRVQNSKALF